MAPPDERTGRLINDRYETLGVLGRGGQGIVYRARDRWMEREVAIKVLGSKAAREPQMGERLVREQQALSALKGTSAVEVLDICRGNDGELCLVMELLTGTDLENYLYSLEDRKERIASTRVAEIFDPIVDTLETAHDAGILHRDLKPANVFLLDSGGVRLLDFGMARLRKAAPLTAAGTVMGSPSFMAPEAWKGQSELVDHRADVYSLGVILFRVVSGELPFSGPTLQEKFLGTTRGARPSLVAKRPELPKAVDDWVALALAVDREERFQTVRALWTSFLTAFDVESPKRRPWRASFWAAAKQAVKSVAGSAAPARGEVPRAEPSDTREPSFGTQALARSVAPHDPSLYAPDAALQFPEPAPQPPRPEVEITLELSDGELVPASSAAPPAVEKTLELDDADLHLGEDTLPDARPPAPPPPRRPR